MYVRYGLAQTSSTMCRSLIGCVARYPVAALQYVMDSLDEVRARVLVPPFPDVQRDGPRTRNQ